MYLIAFGLSQPGETSKKTDTQLENNPYRIFFLLLPFPIHKPYRTLALRLPLVPTLTVKSVTGLLYRRNYNPIISQTKISVLQKNCYCGNVFFFFSKLLQSVSNYTHKKFFLTEWMFVLNLFKCKITTVFSLFLKHRFFYSSKTRIGPLFCSHAIRIEN